MGLLERFIEMVKAKISRLLGEAEDPGETLDYSYERQLELLQDVKRGVADVVTSKKRLQLQAGKLEQSLPKLEGQAREALGAGREDLARRALTRRAALQEQLRDLDQQVESLEAQQDKLVTAEQQLQVKVESFRTQKETIKAQYSAAEARVRINEAATGIGEQMADTGLAIQRARDRMEQMEARAQALDELVESGVLDDITQPEEIALDRELHEIAARSEVEREIDRLRNEIGGPTVQEIER